MQQTTKLANTLDSSTYLQFYNIMKYPIPKQKELFFEGKKVENIKINKEFSRDKKNPYMDEFLQKIEEIHNLLLSLPFVESIYLCNSISFNALQKNSDIDLFIITNSKRIRTAKFRSMILFSLYGVKRF
ncbi:MAG: hypothetical protein LBI53_04805 [Candidatus Peribacteria bacterium]|jgi:hypothetical protein|nr:hypothetical protein [Candidatus Peribacteria bacterium]